MRILAFAAAALLASAGAALAAPASVSVTVGPQLQAKAAAILGVRDVNDLAAELQKARGKPAWPRPAPMTARGSSLS